MVVVVVVVVAVDGSGSSGGNTCEGEGFCLFRAWARSHETLQEDQFHNLTKWRKHFEASFHSSFRVQC